MLWEQNIDSAVDDPADDEPDLVTPEHDPLQAAIAAMRGSLAER